MAFTTVPHLLTEKELCEYLRKSRPWAQRARLEGTGPPYVKAGRTVLYPADGVKAWLMKTQRTATCEEV